MAAGTDQTLKAPCLLLTGASSQVGLFAIPRLIEAGFEVLAISRKGKPEAYPSFENVAWLTGPDALEAAEACQHLISAGPLELAQKFLTAGLQLQSAVVFSSSSVASKQESSNTRERDQMQALLALETKLQTIASKRDIKLVIFRPTLIYGCGLDTNISRLANWIRRFGFMPVNGKANGLRQPVHADDLASVAVSALQSKSDLPAVLFLTGGETLTYADMLERIFKALGRPARIVHLPQWLFVLMVKLAGMVKTGTGINSEMVKRQKLDLVFDDRQARELLGYDPRPFVPLEKDFSLPVDG